MAHCMKQAMLTLLQHDKLSSSLACRCRDMLVMNCSCAGAAVYLTIEYIHDELDFFSKVIFSDQKTAEWMLGYMRSSQKDDVIDAEVMEVLLQYALNSNAFDLQEGPLCVRKALLAEAQTVIGRYGWSGQLHGHLRLYCVLIGAAHLQPTPEELEFWLQSLIDAERFICERTLQLGLAFLCLMPGLTTNTVTRSLFHKCVSVLLTRAVDVETRFAVEVEEQIVWFSVQLFLRQFSEIAMVIREVLGMNVTVQSASLRELHDAAMAVEAISDPFMLMQAVVALRPKGPLSTKTRHGQYILECLEQLLKSGHFSRNGVDVSEAILHCISVSTTPIHGLLIQVIKAYTEAPATIVHGRTGSQMFRMLPLPRSFLEDSMLTIPSLTLKREMDDSDNKNVKSTPDTLAREVLTSYYMLCAERALRSGKGAGNFESSLTLVFSPPDCEGSWWTALLSRIPFHHLLHNMEKRWLEFTNILPQWLSLAASLFPERLVIPDLLASPTKPFTLFKEFDGQLASDDMETLIAISEHSKSGSSLSHGIDTQAPEKEVILNVDSARRAMDNALVNPLPALQILSFSNLKSSGWGNEYSKELLDYQVLIIKELVPKLLDPLCAQCLQERFCAWFKSLQPLLRQTLLPVFVEAILDTSPESKITSDTGLVMGRLKAMVVELNTTVRAYNNLVQQPLVLLACKLEVYQTPLLSIVLDVLHELRIINRRVYLGIVSEGVAIEQSLKSEEVTSALLAQDSAICQILLEACSSISGLGNNLEPGPLLEAQKMIFGFLSLLLESDNVLLKLLHFQGYDQQLISMMVKEVPAMVGCLNFVPELLQQQQQSKQVFTIILVANLACAHVELPQSVVAVQKALAHVVFVQRNALGSSSFMQGVLGAIVQCACAFSAVADDVVDILQGCLKSSGPVNPGGSPCDPMLHTATLSAFKHLLHQQVLFGRLSETSFSSVPAAT